MTPAGASARRCSPCLHLYICFYMPRSAVKLLGSDRTGYCARRVSYPCYVACLRGTLSLGVKPHCQPLRRRVMARPPRRTSTTQACGNCTRRTEAMGSTWWRSPATRRAPLRPLLVVRQRAAWQPTVCLRLHRQALDTSLAIQTTPPHMQFGGQAPGTSEEQRQAAFRKFGFEFDVMDKLLVNGEGAHPLYKYLRSVQPTSVPRNSRSPAGSSAIEWCAAATRRC